VLRRVADALEGEAIAGFLTDEIREGDRRTGFRIVPFRGQDRVMAHIGFRGSKRVGRYGVDVEAIDQVVETSLSIEADVELYLVDEIGKMECLSSRFVRAMQRLLESDRPLVATVALRGTGFIAQTKQRSDVEIWEVNEANRDELPGRIRARLLHSRPGC
jgi:nucleoside-triphosphatase